MLLSKTDSYQESQEYVESSKILPIVSREELTNVNPR